MKKIFNAMSLMIIFFLLLLFPEPVKAGAKEGLTLWYNSVVPILLPFLILSNAIVATDSLSLFLQPFFSLARRLPGLNPWICYPLFFGLFCGFPMGGKTVSDLLRKGRLSIKEASFLLPIVNQASPMFIAGYVGVHILGNTLSFQEMLFFLYTPPLCILLPSILFTLGKNAYKKRNIYKESNTHGKTHKGLINLFLTDNPDKNRIHINKKDSMSPDSEHTIWHAFYIIVVIGIYMMLFTIGVRLCLTLLPQTPHLDLLLSCLEFTTGLERIRHLHFLSQGQKTGLILALTSSGGICTAVQTIGVMKETPLSLWSYLGKKLLISVAVYVLYMVVTN